MKIFSRFLFLAFLALLWSCQPDEATTDEAQRHLPADAAFVLSYQPRPLMDKAGYDETMRWPAVQDMLSQAQKENPYIARILENPAESGVDLDARFYFAADLDLVENNPKANYAYWLFSIADAGKFAKLWKEMDVPVRPIANDNRYLTENGESFISWTDTWGVVGTGAKDQMQAKLAEIVEMKPEASLAANKNFRQCLSEEADAALWMGSNGRAGSIAASGLTILANYSEEDLQDNYLHHFLYFEDGLVRTQSKFFIKRKLTNDLDLFFRDEVKTDFTKALPEGKLEAVFTAALNPQGINQILIEKYAKRAVQEAVNQQGLSFDDLLDAVHGDMALAAYEQDSTEEGLFIAKIGERDKLDGLLQTAVAKGIATEKSEGFYQIHFKQTVKDTAKAEEQKFELNGLLLIRDDLIYMGSSEELLAKVQNGQYAEGAVWQPGLREMSKTNIFAFLAPVFEIPLGDKVEVEKITLHTNRKTAALQIHLADKDRNSLYQLMQSLRKEMEEQQKKKEEGKKI